MLGFVGWDQIGLMMVTPLVAVSIMLFFVPAGQLQGISKNCHPGNFSLRKPKTRFPVWLIFNRLRDRKWRDFPVPHRRLEFFEVPFGNMLVKPPSVAFRPGKFITIRIFMCLWFMQTAISTGVTAVGNKKRRTTRTLLLSLLGEQQTLIQMVALLPAHGLGRAACRS